MQQQYDLLQLFRSVKDAETFKAGEIILDEGQSGDKMYVIIEGEVDINFHGKLLETAKPGTTIGEMALIDNSPRSGDVVARTDVRLAPIDRKHFLYMVQETPSFALLVMHIMADRLRAQHK